MAISLVVYRRRVDKIRRQKVRLEIEVVKRTRQITEQSKKIHDQKQRVEIQKGKIEHQKELLEKEKEKVEQLLLNILPEGTAEELKNKGREDIHHSVLRINVLASPIRIAKGTRCASFDS